MIHKNEINQKYISISNLVEMSLPAIQYNLLQIISSFKPIKTLRFFFASAFALFYIHLLSAALSLFRFLCGSFVDFFLSLSDASYRTNCKRSKYNFVASFFISVCRTYKCVMNAEVGSRSSRRRKKCNNNHKKSHNRLCHCEHVKRKKLNYTLFTGLE